MAGATLTADEDAVASGKENTELVLLLNTLSEESEEEATDDASEETDDDESMIAEESLLEEGTKEMELESEDEETCAVKYRWLCCIPHVRRTTKKARTGRIKRRSMGTS